MDADFRNGGESLEAADFESVCPAEVEKSIVASDEHAAFGREGGEGVCRPLVDFHEACGVGFAACCEGFGLFGEQVGEGCDDGWNGFRPEEGVAPYVWVVAALEIFFGCEQALWVDGFGDGDGVLAASCHGFEGGVEATFEMEAVVEDGIGLFDQFGVADFGNVAMGIDAGTHQADDADVVAADDGDEVAHHGGGGDGERAWIVGLFGAWFAGEEDRTESTAGGESNSHGIFLNGNSRYAT